MSTFEKLGMPLTFEQLREKLVGKTFIAQPGIENHKILYTYQLGGGINGRVISEGDVVEITSVEACLGGYVCRVKGILRRVTAHTFLNKDFFMPINLY